MHLFGAQFKPPGIGDPRMLMKSAASSRPTSQLMQSIDANLSRLWLVTKQLCRAINHRRGIAALAAQDDRLLADIGLTRDDVRSAIAQPFWRDPTEVLRQHAGMAWRISLHQRFASPDEGNRRALAALDANDL